MSITQIDAGLARYYGHKEVPYINDYGIGKFIAWCEENGYDTDTIQDELQQEPSQCYFTAFDSTFPTTKQIDKERMIEIYNIIKYCFEDPKAFLNSIDLPKKQHSIKPINEPSSVHNVSFEHLETKIDYNYTYRLSTSSDTSKDSKRKYSIKEIINQLTDSGYNKKMILNAINYVHNTSLLTVNDIEGVEIKNEKNDMNDLIEYIEANKFNAGENTEDIDIPVFRSKSQYQLLISGYIRSIRSNIHYQTFPLSLHQVLFGYYHILTGLLQFRYFPGEDRLGLNYGNNLVLLTYNNVKATKISDKNSPIWLTSNLGQGIHGMNGLKTGIHVFRYNIHVPRAYDMCEMFFGLQLFHKDISIEKNDYDQFIGRTEQSKFVFGWEPWGEHNIKYTKNDSVKNDRLQHCFSSQCTKVVFDLKLNCNQNTLSYKAVLIDNKEIDETEKNEITTIHLPSEQIKQYGLAPHFFCRLQNTSIIICKMDVKLFGIPCSEIDDVINKMLMDNKDTKSIEVYLLEIN